MPATILMPELQDSPCNFGSSGDAAYQEKVLYLHPLLFLPIQENNAQFSVHDVSGRNRHGHVHGDATLNTHPGPFGGSSAVDFDGTVDIGLIAVREDGSTFVHTQGGYRSWTQEIWFSCTTQPTDATLFDKSSKDATGSYLNTLTITTGGSLRYRLAHIKTPSGTPVDITSASTNVDDDNWHHVAIVRENTAQGDSNDRVTMYIDGVQEAQATYPVDGQYGTLLNGDDLNHDWIFGAKGSIPGQMDLDLYDGQIAYYAFYPYAVPLATLQNHAAHT